MTSLSIKHMLADYERWKSAFNELIMHCPDFKIVGYKTEMERSNPKILTTQISLTDPEDDHILYKAESIKKILDSSGLSHGYEIESI